MPTLPFTVYNLGQPALSSLNLVFLTERRMMNFISQGTHMYVKGVCNQVQTDRLRLFISPKNWQLELNSVTKESTSRSCHQQLRPVISLRTYDKAAKLTLLSTLPQNDFYLSPLLHLQQTKQNNFVVRVGGRGRGEEEVIGGLGRADSLVQRGFSLTS